MRKVWREITDMNPLESDNKLVTYHSWFACPLLDDLQADSRTHVQNGGVLCALSKRIIQSFFPLFLEKSFSVEAPCFLHALPSQTVFDFLTMSFFLGHYGLVLASEGQQQTNQPNDQASDQSYLVPCNLAS